MLKKVLFVVFCVLFCQSNFAVRYKDCSLQKSSNDVSVIFVDTTNKNDYSRIAFCISVGTADEIAHDGIANLLGNLFCTSLKNSIENDDKLSGTDVRFIAGYDKSIFYINCKSENIEKVIQSFSEKFVNFSVTNADVDGVKEIIAKQISSRQQTDADVLYDEARRALYWHSKYGMNVLGTAESLNAITLADIIHFKNKFYRSNRLFVVVSGYSDKSTMINMIQKYFTKMEPVEIQRLQEPSHHESTSEIIKTSEQVASSVIQMFWTVPCFRTSSTEAIVLEILSAHIEKNLKKILAEEQKIVTSISVKTSLWNYDNGEIILTAEVPNNIDIEYVKTAILAEL
nr:insulinase family protein [Alphaproteobacteria bacterium]